MWIARTPKRWTDLGPFQLLDPATNIRLGTRYLRQTLSRFGGVKEYALAAYNAGDERVTDWRAGEQSQGIDEFVESIPFSETRIYVENILRETLRRTRRSMCLPPRRIRRPRRWDDRAEASVVSLKFQRPKNNQQISDSPPPNSTPQTEGPDLRGPQGTEKRYRGFAQNDSQFCVAYFRLRAQAAKTKTRRRWGTRRSRESLGTRFDNSCTRSPRKKAFSPGSPRGQMSGPPSK